MIDIHNHLLPGVDDGASDLDQARSALQAYRHQGVHRLLVTPHVESSLLGQPERREKRMLELDTAYATLRALADAEFQGIDVVRGAEVMLDAPDPVLDDPRVRIHGTSCVLVEFPHMHVFPRSADVLFGIRMAGYTPVVAHPERYTGLDADLQGVGAWKRAGALLQINAGSLLGKYGKSAEANAWELLARGAADVLASDHHARGTLHLAAARDALVAQGGSVQADLLLSVNPSRILSGEPPLEVPRLARRRRGFWKLFSSG